MALVTDKDLPNGLSSIIPTTSDIDMSCYVLTDGDWAIIFPAGTTIGAGQYLTIGVDAFASCPNCDNADPRLVQERLRIQI
ncbi:MAG: hypothetical protein H6554_03935 [Chitinophagales bacterium]|nr:hypothetical protein [Chitinophagales bacterium]